MSGGRHDITPSLRGSQAGKVSNGGGQELFAVLAVFAAVNGTKPPRKSCGCLPLDVNVCCVRATYIEKKKPLVRFGMQHDVDV